MTGEEIRKLVKYLWNIEHDQFARDIYRKEPDPYTLEKFNKMQEKTTFWIGTLDKEHMQRLADVVGSYEG
jgi:hypothetical protein